MPTCVLILALMVREAGIRRRDYFLIERSQFFGAMIGATVGATVCTTIASCEHSADRCADRRSNDRGPYERHLRDQLRNGNVVWSLPCQSQVSTKEEREQREESKDIEQWWQRMNDAVDVSNSRRTPHYRTIDANHYMDQRLKPQPMDLI